MLTASAEPETLKPYPFRGSVWPSTNGVREADLRFVGLRMCGRHTSMASERDTSFVAVEAIQPSHVPAMLSTALTSVAIQLNLLDAMLYHPL
jgi:hypothetical protein